MPAIFVMETNQARERQQPGNQAQHQDPTISGSKQQQQQQQQQQRTTAVVRCALL
nr:putative mediator of RNA polymerase II transcription subunit 12 [Drosophila virilis]